MISRFYPFWKSIQLHKILMSSFLILTLFVASSSLLLPFQNADASHMSLSYTAKNWGTDTEVKIKNSGSSTAKNMYVWVAWDKDADGKVWKQTKYGPMSLKPGYTKTVTLYLAKPPVGEWTRFKVSVWGDNFNTIKDIGDWKKRGGSSNYVPTTDWNQICKDQYGSNYKYNSSTKKCYKSYTAPSKQSSTSSSTWLGKIVYTVRDSPYDPICQYKAPMVLVFNQSGDKITGHIIIDKGKLWDRSLTPKSSCSSTSPEISESVKGWIVNSKYNEFKVSFNDGSDKHQFSGYMKNYDIKKGQYLKCDISCGANYQKLGTFTATRN